MTNVLEQMTSKSFTDVVPGRIENLKKQIAAEPDPTKKAELQVRRLKQQGLSPEEAAKQVDMTAHAKLYTNIRGAGVDVRGVRRLYDLLDGRDIIR